MQQWWVGERQSLQELLHQEGVFVDRRYLRCEKALEEHAAEEAKDHTAKARAVEIESIFNGIAVDLHDILEDMVFSVFHMLPVKVKRHQKQVLEMALIFREVLKEDGKFFGDRAGGVKLGSHAGHIAARHQGKHLLKEGFFVGKIVIKQACGNIEFTGKFAHGHSRVATLRKQRKAGRKEFFAALIMIHNLGHRVFFLVVGKRRQVRASAGGSVVSGYGV